GVPAQRGGAFDRLHHPHALAHVALRELRVGVAQSDALQISKRLVHGVGIPFGGCPRIRWNPDPTAAPGRRPTQLGSFLEHCDGRSLPSRRPRGRYTGGSGADDYNVRHPTPAGLRGHSVARCAPAAFKTVPMRAKVTLAHLAFAVAAT